MPINQPHRKKVVIITGPTAVGKTAVAIEVARLFDTEIISADSRQCFRELNIGVARPSIAELSEVTHHFIASHSIHEEVTAVTFEQFALGKVEELFKKKDVVVMTGGTGLYIQAFTQGLDEIPAVDAAIRKQIADEYADKGLPWLQEQIKAKDPVFFQKGEILNPQRMMRALEVVEATGQSVLSYRKGNRAQRDFDIVHIGLQLPKEELHRNIHLRVEKMLELGLLDEVNSLQPYKNLNALRTVGYSEIFSFLEGDISLEKAIEQIKTNTRRYAKRQMTWFRKDEQMKWFAPAQLNEVISAAKGQP